MVIFTTIIEAKNYLKSQFGKSIGFVPTMGALHEGHISLIKKCKEENELAVCSIFVNPIQFNKSDDLERYPRTVESDLEMLLFSGCDVAFLPSATEMYPEPNIIQMNFGDLANKLEGEFRPGHFSGVGVAVSKLLHIIEPHKAYFGLKDLQQVSIINLMVKQLNISVEVISCATFREADGLAMSSRNRRLSDSERILAPQLFKALTRGKEMALELRSVDEIKEEIRIFLSNTAVFKLEYFEVVDFKTLQPLETLESGFKVALVLATYLGEVRLIDNILVEL